MAGQLKTETMVVLGVALAVIAMGWYIKGKVTDLGNGIGDEAGKLWDAAKDGAQVVNPFNENNIFNQAATGFYQAATGSTGTIGGDLYDTTHGIETTVKPESPVGIAGTSIFEAMTGGTYDN